MAEKYLGIKNWDVYQNRMGKRDYIKDSTNKDADADYSKLSAFCRYLLDGLQRLRGRLGKNPENDATWIARALLMLPTDRPHVRHAIDTLIAQGFLIPMNQQVDSLEERRGEERRGEKTDPTPESQNPTPETPKEPTPIDRDFKPIEVAKVLCDFEHLNLSGNHNLRMGAEIIEKAMQAWCVDALEAVRRITENWQAYRRAPLGHEKRKQSAVFWLSDGSWNTAFMQKPVPLNLVEKRILREKLGVEQFTKPVEEYRRLLREAERAH